MIHLRTLGGLSIEHEGQAAAAVTAQRKALAILAMIACSGERGVSRDRLLALFWPESAAGRARNALNQILHAIRRAFPDEQVILGVAELRANPQVLAVDACEFESAVDRGDLERAAQLYTGAFLDGICDASR